MSEVAAAYGCVQLLLREFQPDMKLFILTGICGSLSKQGEKRSYCSCITHTPDVTAAWFAGEAVFLIYITVEDQQHY